MLKKKFVLAAVLLGFMGGSILAFSNVIFSYFQSDDFYLVGKLISSGLADTVRSKAHGGFLRPLAILSYVTDLKIWGLNPMGYHLTNILVHGANSFLVSLLAVLLLRLLVIPAAKHKVTYTMAGIIFLVLPSHSESVSWIAGRTDVIATFFMLISITGYTAYLIKPAGRVLMISLAGFACALCTKESAAAVPLVVVSLACFANAAGRKKNLGYPGGVFLSSGSFFAVLGLYLLTRRLAIGGWIGGYGKGVHVNFPPEVILDRLARFITRAFLPPLSPRYYELFNPGGGIFYAVVIATMLVIGAVAFSGKTRRGGAFFLTVLTVCFLLSLLPSLTLRVNYLDTQGERFLYFPSVFSSIWLAGITLLFPKRKRAALAVLTVFVIWSAIHLYRVNENWVTASRLSRTIIGDIVSKTDGRKILAVNVPDNYRGAYVFRNGFREAIRLFAGQDAARGASVICTHSLGSLSEGVSIVPRDEGSLVNYHCALKGDGVIYRVRESRLIRAVRRTGRKFWFRFKRSPEDCDIFFFDSGSMKRVDGIRWPRPEYE